MVASYAYDAINLHRVTMKAAVVSSDAGFRLTTLTVNNTNTHTFALMMKGLHVDPKFNHYWTCVVNTNLMKHRMWI